MVFVEPYCHIVIRTLVAYKISWRLTLRFSQIFLSTFALNIYIMAGSSLITGTTDTSRTEAPVIIKACLICAFAAFSGIFFGYDTGWMGDVLAIKHFI